VELEPEPELELELELHVEESASQVSSMSQHVDPQTVCIDEHVCI
jgi:hypothetical protein